MTKANFPKKANVQTKKEKNTQKSPIPDPVNGACNNRTQRIIPHSKFITTKIFAIFEVIQVVQDS